MRLWKTVTVVLMHKASKNAYQVCQVVHRSTECM